MKSNKRLIGILLTIAGLLTIPAIAMMAGAEGVDWSLSDFIIMGILLLITGLSVEAVMRKVKSPARRLLVCGAILLGFLLIWAELAVGIFGSPWAGS